MDQVSIIDDDGLKVELTGIDVVTAWDGTLVFGGSKSATTTFRLGSETKETKLKSPSATPEYIHESTECMANTLYHRYFNSRVDGYPEIGARIFEEHIYQSGRMLTYKNVDGYVLNCQKKD